MAGCKKADRNRKSVQNAAYKAGKKWAINTEKRALREEKRVGHDAARVASMKVKRGTARALRRVSLQRQEISNG